MSQSLPGPTAGVRDAKLVTIRLYGVDTPEKAQAFGNRTKQFTATLVADKVVDVETVTTDKYGRTVGLVTVDGKLLDTELVKAGMAWVYRKYCDDRQPLCKDLLNQESKARANGVGLWADADPTPPWDWRKGKKVQNSNPETDNGSYHGNIKSKVFHRPGSKDYNCKNCTEEFLTRDDALSAGYRPCGTCEP